MYAIDAGLEIRPVAVSTVTSLQTIQTVCGLCTPQSHITKFPAAEFLWSAAGCPSDTQVLKELRDGDDR